MSKEKLNFPPIGNGEPWTPSPDPTMAALLEIAKGAMQSLIQKNDRQAAREEAYMEEKIWWEAAQAYDSTWPDKIKHADAIRHEFWERFRK